MGFDGFIMVLELQETSKFASIATGGGLKLRWLRGLEAFGGF